MSKTTGIKAGKAYVELSLQDRVTRGLNQVEQRLKDFGASIRQVGTRIAALGAGMAVPLIASVKIFSDAGGQLDDMSQRTGVSVEKLSQLGHVAQLSGSNLQSLAQTLFRMNRRIANAATGSGPAVRALRELGVTASDLSQLDAGEQIKVIADRLNGLGDPALAAQYAFEILGDGARELMPLIKLGSAGNADHTFADVSPNQVDRLQSAESGSASILWKEDGTGLKWAIVRLTNPSGAGGGLPPGNGQYKVLQLNAENPGVPHWEWVRAHS